ncbi:MAG: acyltransferase [Lachnospiraceae bacterium]|nr:acyltransferase [Lachnospiraceae bacterium]
MNFFLIFTVIIFPLIILRSIKKIDCETTYLLGKQETSVIRGISAIFIIESHFLAWTIEMGAEVNIILQLIIGQLGGIGVLLFFFVSGYGIYVSYAKEKPGWEFIRKRLENVYIPYVFMKLVLLVLFGLKGKNIENWGNRVLRILLLEDWFIRVIVLQYFSFLLLRKFLGLKGKKILIGSFVIDGILSLAFVIQQRPLGWFNALWLFTVGFVVAEYKTEIFIWFQENFIPKCTVLFFLFLISGSIFAYFKDEVFWINVFKIISGCFLVLFLCGILQVRELKSNILSYIGERSMYYYIVHLNVWELLSFVNNINLKVIVTFFIIIFFSECLFRGFEKLKGVIYGMLCKE